MHTYVCVCVCVFVYVLLSHQPEIHNITPSELSFYGKNNALLTGRNLADVVGVRLQGHLDCGAREWVKKHHYSTVGG